MPNYTDCQNNIIFWVQLIGNISTMVAVVLILWQTRYPFRKKVKINFNFSNNQYVYNENKWQLLHNKDMCIFQIYNVGNISINIVEFGFVDQKKVILIPLTSNKLGMENEEKISNLKSLPQKLNPQENLEFVYNFEYIKKYIMDTQYSNKKDCRHVYMHFKDSIGDYTFKKILIKKHYIIYKGIKDALEEDKNIFSLKSYIIRFYKKTFGKRVDVIIKNYNNKDGYGVASLDGNDICIKKEMLVKKEKKIKPGEKIGIYI